MFAEHANHEGKNVLGGKPPPTSTRDPNTLIDERYRRLQQMPRLLIYGNSRVMGGRFIAGVVWEGWRSEKQTDG